MVRLLFGFILTAAGAAHFKRPGFFSKMIPFLGRGTNGGRLPFRRRRGVSGYNVIH
ncbi:hypothetical protein [Sinobaca sp. H24]|uniref:hypothetical protein n=1 Tax=Sinobaca sp. H24 TaxID=2923376 RepID=UPI00207989F2|nr:hypothetical protein [Sinobaca sp. H24]